MSEFWQQKAREYAERQKQQSANLNPSDEKLREMIAEKDAEIERLAQTIEELNKKVNQEFERAEGEKDSRQRLQILDEEKDAEIARLKEDCEA